MTERALLLTDLVDSTKLAERLGDARAAEAWAAHDRVARDLLPAHGGREIDKSDGFLLLFESAEGASSYAMAYHAALRDLSSRLGVALAARAGLHVGDVTLRENSAADVARGAKPLEVEGLAKSVVARAMGVARGGQTLVTAEAADRLALGRVQARPDGAVPGSAEPVLLSHGHWMLKGLPAPVALHEVGVPGEAPMTPPADTSKAWRVVWRNEAWVPQREVKHGLPRERDAFVGREADLKALAHRLDEGAALVSVLGIGGTGKTRLVTHYAWTWLGSWPGGAWFCDLSEARSVEGIASAVARALDVPLGKDDPIVQLGHAIAGRGKCLVILDNFEQVARHAPATLGHWLDRASEAQFVVTTREVLGLPGEVALALAPLRESEAVDLFVTRAVQAKRDFALAEADRPRVRALVKLLDGLPLAIELAAARVRVMQPSVLLERMSERFKVLTSSGGRHTRQATLRATLDWSWDLLSPDERQALAQVSVFEGGFTLESAEAVLKLSEAWPADAVQGLVDKSLVRRVSDERFDLLVSVQEHATEKLDALGGRAEAEARHGKHFATHGAVEALAALDAHGGVARRQALALELENLLVASRRAVAREDGPTAVGTLAAAWTLLELKGPFGVGGELARQVVGLGTLAPVDRGGATRVLARALKMAGRMDESSRHYHDCLAIARELGDRRFEAIVLGNLGSLHHGQGRMEEAWRHYHEALAIHREVGNRRFEGTVLGNLGNLHAEQGRMQEALRHFQEALALHRRSGARRLEGHVLGNLGVLHREQGRMEEALRHYQDALAIAREVGDRHAEGIVLGNLGNLHQGQGRMEEALTHLQDALAIAREVGDRRNEGIVLGNVGNLHREQGRMEEALRHYQDALAIHREVGDRHKEGAFLGELGELHSCAGRAGDARSALAEGERLLRAVGDSLALGRLLCSLARLERSEGNLEAAAAALAAAQSCAAEVAAGAGSGLGQAIARLRTELGTGASGPDATSCASPQPG